MNLHRMLQQRAAEGRPLRVGLIGAGKFGTMYLSQALRTPGIHLVGVADLQPARAKAALRRVGWPADRLGAKGFADVERLRLRRGLLGSNRSRFLQVAGKVGAVDCGRRRDVGLGDFGDRGFSFSFSFRFSGFARRD